MTAEKAYTRAATLCSRSEQAESDIREKLAGWGIDEADVEQIVQRLREGNYLNEQRYAHAFVHDKFAFNGWGKIKMAFMLKQKQVSPAVIEEALAAINHEEYREKLMSLLYAKMQAQAGRDALLVRASLLRLAASRGYEPSVFYGCVDRTMAKFDTLVAGDGEPNPDNE